MEASGAGRVESVLPRLLALPAGTVAGLAPSVAVACPSLAVDLSLFGPLLRQESDLRHAARRPPARLVFRAGRSAPPVVAAALDALRRAGSVAVIQSADPGWVVEWSDRILVRGVAGLAWVSPGAMRARRRLLLRVEAGPARRNGEWLRVPLDAGDGPEAVITALAAAGVRVCESRIAYEAPVAR